MQVNSNDVISFLLEMIQKISFRLIHMKQQTTQIRSWKLAELAVLCASLVIGGQVGIQSFYFNLGYGVSGTYKVNDEPVESIKCGNFMVGYMVGLDKMKNVFLDLGIGHTIAAPTVQIGPFQEQQGSVTLALGIDVGLAKK